MNLSRRSAGIFILIAACEILLQAAVLVDAGSSSGHGSATSIKLGNKSAQAPAKVSSQPNSSKTKDATSSSANSSTASNVVQLTETEVWDGSEWKAASPTSRWTRKGSRKATTASPDKQEPPSGTTFKGDWKIVTSKTRDSYGWEYTASKPYPRRQRIWLRSVIKLDYDSDSKALVKKNKKKGLKVKRRPKWAQALWDEFNFKGFGMSLYKSLVYPNGCGIALRLPLTFNLNAWERHPALPSVSSSLNFFHPGFTSFLLSTSIRVEWLKWATARTLFLLQYLAVWCVWSLTRGIVLASSALAYPVTRKFYSPPMPMKWISIDDNPCEYSRTTEERIGTSMQWCYSQRRGYEFRISYWHYYAPTMVSLLDRVGFKNKIPPWLARHSAAWGLSIAGPIPDSDPFISCSTLLSFSGFYLKRKTRVKVQREASVIKASASEQVAAALTANSAKGNEEKKKSKSDSDGATKKKSKTVVA